MPSRQGSHGTDSCRDRSGGEGASLGKTFSAAGPLGDGGTSPGKRLTAARALGERETSLGKLFTGAGPLGDSGGVGAALEIARAVRYCCVWLLGVVANFMSATFGEFTPPNCAASSAGRWSPGSPTPDRGALMSAAICIRMPPPPSEDMGSFENPAYDDIGSFENVEFMNAPGDPGGVILKPLFSHAMFSGVVANP